MPDSWNSEIRKECRLVYLETPTNPTLKVIDIEAVARIAHSVERSWSPTTRSPRPSISGRSS